MVGGIVTEIKPIVDRNGKTMAFVTLEDFSGSGEVLVFSEPYALHRELVTIDSLILVHGHLSKKEEDNKVIASEIISLNGRPGPAGAVRRRDHGARTGRG